MKRSHNTAAAIFAFSVGIALMGCSNGPGEAGTAKAGPHIVADWSFDVPAGPKLPDKTGRFDGAALGVRGSDGGGGWYFSGDSAHVRVKNDAAFDLGDGFTIEATVRLARFGNPRNGLGVQGIVEKHVGKGGYLLVVTPEGRLSYWLETPNGRAADTSTTALDIGRWHHVALTWDTARTTFWIDGKPAGSKPFAGPLGSSPQDLYLGNDDTMNWGLDGDIAEIRIANTALVPKRFLR